MFTINELTSIQTLDQFLNTEKLLLIDLWAPWCASCKAMLPTVESIVEEKSNSVSLLKINIDRFPEASERLNVRGLPCLMLYQNRQELLRLTQLMTTCQLKQALSPWLQFEYLNLLNQAEVTNDNNQALALLKQAANLAPQQSAVHLAYIQRLLNSNADHCWQQALAYIEDLNHEVLREPEIGRIQSFLNLIEDFQNTSSTLSPVLELLLAEKYLQALERLTTLMEQGAEPELKELIVKILNVMPDRKLAHQQRLKLYDVIQ
ncbi:MAG TPA: thioredoxin domain-containing protein [Pseudomonadales bacterium]|nr:thioredoxin domain-containing protein [Pseudomonadales bacterium]